MCNLNIMVTKKPSKDNALLFERLTTLSYDNNDDADGVYFSGTDKLHKSTLKLNYLSYAKDFEKSNIVISHQRLTTSGYDESNHQPFQDDELVLAHNGVLSGLGTQDKSDTRMLFEKFTASFYKTLAETTEEREVAMTNAIREHFKSQWGSFSIAIYDKVDNVMYYFKNSTTSIHAYHTDDSMYLMTANNESWLPYKVKPMKIKEYKIYKSCVADKKLIFKEIGEIEREEYYYDPYTSYKRKKYGTRQTKISDNLSVVNTYENDTDSPKFYGYCDECNHHTLVQEKERYDDMIMCKECYDYRRKWEFNNDRESKGVYEMTDEEWEEYNARRFGQDEYNMLKY